ncbi:hypothetical protein ABK040_012421 [Willaertia magna]
MPKSIKKRTKNKGEAITSINSSASKQFFETFDKPTNSNQSTIKTIEFNKFNNNYNSSIKLENLIEKQFNNEKYCDFIFKFNGGNEIYNSIFVNKCIVSYFSNYFKNEFLKNNKNEMTIDINGKEDYHSFYLMIKSFYFTNFFTINKFKEDELLNLINFYDKYNCNKMLKSLFNELNFLELENLVFKHFDKLLKNNLFIKNFLFLFLNKYILNLTTSKTEKTFTNLNIPLNVLLPFLENTIDRFNVLNNQSNYIENLLYFLNLEFFLKWNIPNLKQSIEEKSIKDLQKEEFNNLIDKLVNKILTSVKTKDITLQFLNNLNSLINILNSKNTHLHLLNNLLINYLNKNTKRTEKIREQLH